MDFDFLSLLLFVLYLVTAAFRIWVTKRNLARGVLSNLKSEFWSSNCSNVSLFWSLLFHIPKAKMTWPPHLHLCEIAFNRHPFFTCDLEFLIVSFSLLHLIFFFLWWFHGFNDIAPPENLSEHNTRRLLQAVCLCLFTQFLPLLFLVLTYLFAFQI